MYVIYVFLFSSQKNAESFSYDFMRTTTDHHESSSLNISNTPDKGIDKVNKENTSSNTSLLCFFLFIDKWKAKDQNDRRPRSAPCGLTFFPRVGNRRVNREKTIDLSRWCFCCLRVLIVKENRHDRSRVASTSTPIPILIKRKNKSNESTKKESRKTVFPSRPSLLIFQMTNRSSTPSIYLPKTPVYSKSFFFLSFLFSRQSILFYIRYIFVASTVNCHG